MSSISNLIQYIEQRNHESNMAYLSLYNYLKNLCLSNGPISPELISDYLILCKKFEYWRENQTELEFETKDILKSYCAHYSTSIDFKEIFWPSTYQEIYIEKVEDHSPIIKSDLESNLTIKEFNLTKHDYGQILGILLKDNDELEVNSFFPICFLKEGKIYSYNLGSRLSYDSSLNLFLNSIHEIWISDHSFARFQLSTNGVFGNITRGYTFNKVKELKGGELNQHPSLFYALKKIERNFIEKNSDSFYIELIQILEKAVDLVKHKHTDSKIFAQRAYERGKLALEQIYPEDKLIRLLVNSLEVVVRSEVNNEL